MRDGKRIPQQKRIMQQLTRYGMLRIPSERKIERAIKELEAEPPRLISERGSLIVNGRVMYPWLEKRKRGRPGLKQVWVFAEKPELAAGIKYDKFVPLTQVVRTTRARAGAVRGRLVVDLPSKPDKLPERAVVISDANPVGRFLAESVANYLLERNVDVEFAIASTPKTVKRSLAKYQPLDESGYDPQARFEVLRRIFDAGYTRVGEVIDTLIDKLGLYPKERSIIRQLEEATIENPRLRPVLELVKEGRLNEAKQELEKHANEPGYDRAKQALEMKFILAVRGRLGFTTLAILDDMERESVLTLDLGSGRELKLPASNVGEDALPYTRVRLGVTPLSSGQILTAPSHSECIRYLVSRGLSVDDAEAVLERLWLAGAISYPRNEGTGIPRTDQDDVISSLKALGVEIPSRPFYIGDPGVYIVDAEKASGFTGTEREFVDWLAKRLSSPVTKARIEADVYIGRELVDRRYYVDNVEVASSIEGWFKPTRIETNDEGVSLEQLVARLQQLEIGTEATRSIVLNDLQNAGLITVGDRIKLTHNGRIVATIVKLALKNATDADVIREIFDKLRTAAERNEDVDRALVEAWKTVFEKRKEFAKRVYRTLIAGKRRSLTVPEIVAVALYVRGPMTLRDIRREVIGKRWRDNTPELLKASGYFVFLPGDRKDSIIVKLTPQGELAAKTIIAEMPERFKQE